MILKSHTILYVDDQNKSTDFYAIVFIMLFRLALSGVIERYFRAITLLYLGMRLISLGYSLARYRRYRCYRHLRVGTVNNAAFRST